MDFSAILNRPDFPCSLISEPELQPYFHSSGNNQVHMWYSLVKVMLYWTSQPALWTGGIWMMWHLLLHISLPLAKLLLSYTDRNRGQKSYRCTLIWLALGKLMVSHFEDYPPFSRMLCLDSEGMTSWLADGGGGVGGYMCVQSHIHDHDQLLSRERLHWDLETALQCSYYII